MSRIPTHTVEDAPAASRPLLQKIIQSTPTGRPANLHAQMAHSPAVLTAYTSLRAVLAEHSTFDPKVGAALTLATAAGVGNGYMCQVYPYELIAGAGHGRRRRLAVGLGESRRPYQWCVDSDRDHNGPPVKSLLRLLGQ